VIARGPSGNVVARRVQVAILVFGFEMQDLSNLNIVIDAPPELASIRARLQSIDPARFTGIAELAGLTGAGPLIRVILSPETSDFARSTPPWVAGFAIGESGLVVLFPSRSPTYPDATLEDVLRHEVAHVFISRASGGRPVPRWFNEGLAMAVERQRRFADQTQLLYQLAAGSRTDLATLDRLFSGGQNDQIRAYALAGAMVHDFLEQYGPAAPRQILARVARGESFDAAFAAVTGSTLDRLDTEFWDRQRIWTTWIPIVASSTTLWLAITFLALLAIYMRRRRNREIEARWEDEDDEN
jgi:hypothetical protein